MVDRVEHKRLSRRSFLSGMMGIAGGIALSSIAPERADAASTGTVQGTYLTYSGFYGLSGQFHNWFTYQKDVSVVHFGEVTSTSGAFGAGSVRMRMYIKGVQGQMSPNPYQFINSKSSSYIKVSKAYVDVSDPFLGGYFTAYLYVDLYIGGTGFVTVHTTKANSTVAQGGWMSVRSGTMTPDDLILSDNQGYTPVMGDGGNAGYAKNTDLSGPSFSSPEDCLTYYETTTSHQIPVFAEDKSSIIDTYTILHGVA